MIKLDENWLNKNTGKYICPHCDKEYTKKGICTHIWRSHGEGKDFTSNNDGYKKGNRKAWNKGLTKEDDERIKKHSELLSGREGSFKGKTHSKKTLEQMKNNPNQGGYRKGSGRGKSGTYKGYYCDSSWELAYVIYNIEHNIDFERNTEKFKYIFNNEKRYYIPDFIVNDEYVEIKGYMTEQWEQKLKQFDKPIKVIYKDDIKLYLAYVEDKYGKDFISMYE